MTEHPNNPEAGGAGPEGSPPPFTLRIDQASNVHLGGAGATGQAPVPAPAHPMSAAGEEKYTSGIGFALWFACFFGAAGIHRFYLGMYGTGILWLLTFGLLGIGQFMDLFRMRELARKANIRDGIIPHPRQLQQAHAAGQLPAPSHASGGAAGNAGGASKPASAEQRQYALLQAAQKHGGSLTVTQGVLETGLGFHEVEEALREMVVVGYVDVDNAAESGVVVYRFPGLLGPSP